MKQIFPSIRPRRLGTRGNSRYCYAAMRKTTKLECPHLPDLGKAKNGTNVDQAVSNYDENLDEKNAVIGLSGSWKIIKMWAESLLNIEFKGANELADYISENYNNGTPGTISNKSRTLLQKKLLQRKVKGRKKKSISISEVIVISMLKK